MSGKASEVKVRVREVSAGEGDMAAWSIDRRQHGAMMAGEHGASVADSAWHRCASTIPCSRDARTAISLNVNWLPRDARVLVPRCAKRARFVEAQLPLLMTMKPSFERIAGSLPRPRTMKPSSIAGPYTSRSIPWGRESLIRASLASRGRVTVMTPTRALGIRVTPPPAPSQGRGTFAVPHRHHRSHPVLTILTGGHH
ncbi:MAG: hypothetical protein A4E60_01692 [Syntrophorhabdus sp. PtaB.Bin047]|nr:MAG: hypothetical protein A4E60_01692 [Syntrophorhabdus sp. PtaB.Bin047]